MDNSDFRNLNIGDVIERKHDGMRGVIYAMEKYCNDYLVRIVVCRKSGTGGSKFQLGFSGGWVESGDKEYWIVYSKSQKVIVKLSKNKVDYKNDEGLSVSEGIYTRIPDKIPTGAK